MPEKKFVSRFRKYKVIQLIFLLVIDIAFHIFLFWDPSKSKNVLSDKYLFVLCATDWLLMLFTLLSLLNDFLSLKSFALESHALNRVAYLDTLTGIPNRHGLDVIFRTYDTPESMASIGCCMMTISNLKELNDKLGREKGNTVICDFSKILEQVGDRYGAVGRNGGNEFIIVINSATEKTIETFRAALSSELDKYNQAHTGAPIEVKSVYTLNAAEKATAFPELLIVTYNKLHSAE